MGAFGKVAIVTSAVVLIGCGGGGQKDAHVKGVGAGYYQPADSNGNASVENDTWHDTVILEDGTYYSLYQTSSFEDPDSWSDGLIQGTGKGNKNGFVSTDLRDFSVVGETFSGRLDATFPDQDTIKGTVTISVGNASQKSEFEGKKLDKKEFDFDKKANLQDVVGKWFIYDPLASSAGQLVVKNNNTFSGSFGGNDGCIFDGKITPHSSGKNLFDVQLKYGPYPCVAPGESGAGIAVVSQEEGGPSLVFMGNNKARTLGTGFYGYTPGV